MIWVEVLSRHYEVLHRQRFEASTLRIGRAYDNDLILDDPHVAPHHLMLSANEIGEWVAEDLATANGLFTEPDGRRHKSVTLSDDRIVNIGRSYLRLRRAAYPVAAERALANAPAAGAGGAMWRTLALLAIALFGSLMIGLWNTETSEPKTSRFLAPLLGMVLVLLLWTTMWALLTRLFTGSAQFQRHLRIALTGLLVASVIGELLGYAAYGFSLTSLSSMSAQVVWVAAAFTAFFHLRVLGRGKLWLKGSVVASIAGLAIAMTLISNAERQARFGEAITLRALKPPAFRIVPQQSEDSFMAKAEALKTKLDRARREEKPGESGSGFDFAD